MNGQKDHVGLNDIADMLVSRIAEAVRGKEPEYGSITFTFSPASDTINYKVEISRHISIKSLTENGNNT